MIGGARGFALIFSALTLAMVLQVWAWGSGWAAIGLWPAAGTAIIALAYAGEHPRLLGKGDDGRIAVWSWVLGLPVHAFSALIWRLQRAGGEDFANEVAPGIWVGRRPLQRDLQDHEFATIVDLTAEFAAVSAERDHPGYRCMPILDGTLPQVEALRAIVEPLVDAPDPVLVHCAVGHGRSAGIAAALALARGLVADPRQAIAAMQKARPRIRLRKQQRERLERWFATLPRA